MLGLTPRRWPLSSCATRHSGELCLSGIRRHADADARTSWEAELRGVAPDAVRQMWIDATPLARLETPEDVAKVVAFLASDDAEFITGEAISVNGGAFMD